MNCQMKITFVRQYAICFDYCLDFKFYLIFCILVLLTNTSESDIEYLKNISLIIANCPDVITSLRELHPYFATFSHGVGGQQWDCFLFGTPSQS